MRGSKKISEQDSLNHLDALDAEGGVNQKPKPSLRPVEQPSMRPQPTNQSTVSLANDLGWKVIPFNNLPSQGRSYPVDSELAIKAASVGEIRHWSTIDESDLVSVNDKLNFILEKCVSFKIKGEPIIMDWRDLSLFDRFFLIFRIHELTFPNNENNMVKHFACGQCPSENKYQEALPIRSSMLQLYTYPQELMAFYSEEHRAFAVEATSYDPFLLFIPSLGAMEKVKAYIKFKGTGLKDDWFIKAAPYLIDDYRFVTNQWLDNLRLESMGWPEKKFMFVTKAVEMLEAGKATSVAVRCPKCDNFIHQNIFTSPSFTIKNLFIVSTRLANLI